MFYLAFLFSTCLFASVCASEGNQSNSVTPSDQSQYSRLNNTSNDHGRMRNNVRDLEEELRPRLDEDMPWLMFEGFQYTVGEMLKARASQGKSDLF